VTTSKNRSKSDTAGMLRGRRADTNSSYWESQNGHLATMEGMGRTHSKSGSGTSIIGTREVTVSAVYMVEACLNTYTSAMESDEVCEWPEAIYSQCESWETNKVLELVHEISETKKAIPAKLSL